MNHVYLQGAEDVRRASYLINEAADSIRGSASSMDEVGRSMLQAATMIQESTTSMVEAMETFGRQLEQLTSVANEGAELLGGVKP